MEIEVTFKAELTPELGKLLDEFLPMPTCLTELGLHQCCKLRQVEHHYDGISDITIIYDGECNKIISDSNHSWFTPELEWEINNGWWVVVPVSDD